MRALLSQLPDKETIKKAKHRAFLSGHGFFRVARLQIARHHSNVCGPAHLVATEYSLKYDGVIAKFGAKRKLCATSPISHYVVYSPSHSRIFGHESDCDECKSECLMKRWEERVEEVCGKCRDTTRVMCALKSTCGNTLLITRTAHTPKGSTFIPMVTLRLCLAMSGCSNFILIV